jgi:iron complex transport system ATP-binding protein
MVTHRVEEILPMISHVLLLENGKILASGEKTSVLSSENLERLYGLKLELLVDDNQYFIKIKRF